MLRKCCNGGAFPGCNGTLGASKSGPDPDTVLTLTNIAMSSFSSDQVNRIAQLARLKTDEEKSAYFAGHLTRILDLVEQMNRIDTENIEPMAHPQDSNLRLRADEVTAENRREDYQAIAPMAENGLYLVPRVIE